MEGETKIMADLFSTDVVNAVVQNLFVAPQFLTNRYFSTTQTSLTEEIHFDTLLGKRRISPYVSPLVEGQIVASMGYKTGTFRPAYIKDKRVFDMNRPLKRWAGEQIGGTSNPADRLRALIAYDLQDQLEMLNRRLEVQAAEVLATGKATITGEKYPTVVVDFGRDPSLIVSPAKLWSDPTSFPGNDLQAWQTDVLQLEGVQLQDAIMSVAAWIAFKSNPNIKADLNLYRTLGTEPTIAPGTVMNEGGTFMGSYNGFNLWVYSGWYVDPLDGVEKPIFPINTCVLTSPQLMGIRAYGAIRDEAAGLQALPYFVKSWVEMDPSVRYIMMQSAPLMVPYRPNASLVAQVV